MKKLLFFLIVGCIFLMAVAFGKKQNNDDKKKSKYEVIQFDSQYYVTLWLNENHPSEVLGITTTGTYWQVFYVK